MLSEQTLRYWRIIKDMSREELYSYMDAEKDHFKDYSSLWHYMQTASSVRDIFAAAYDHLQIDFKGKTVFDIGPGDCGSLDEAMDRGAESASFIDRDAFIVKWGALKGYDYIFSDYACVDGMEEALAMQTKYDVIVAKGSFNADRWNRNEFGVNPDMVAEWITRISKGHTIVTPTWDMGESVDGHFYACHGEHLDKYLQSAFHMGFVNRGYEVLCIEGYNEPTVRFPITYYKDFR